MFLASCSYHPPRTTEPCVKSLYHASLGTRTSCYRASYGDHHIRKGPSHTGNSPNRHHRPSSPPPPATAATAAAPPPPLTWLANSSTWMRVICGPGTTTWPRYRDVSGVESGTGCEGRRYSNAEVRIMFRSCFRVLALEVDARSSLPAGGEEGHTESVQRKRPRNILVSVVVTRRVLFSSEWR